MDDCRTGTSAGQRKKRIYKNVKEKKCSFLGIPTDSKPRKGKPGLSLTPCFSCLSIQIGKNQLFVVVGRDVGFDSPNRDCPDDREIGTVGMYVDVIPQD